MGKKYIGILGGTFDPPHSGHLSISNMSLKRLGLDEIWWVVTKRNPLKKKTSVYESRLKKVRNYLEKQRIKIYQFESEENIYTIDLIKSLDVNIKSVSIFDVFEGGNMSEGKKSIAVNVTIQSMEKTLSEKDLNEVSQKIINIVKAKTGGTIRS